MSKYRIVKRPYDGVLEWKYSFMYDVEKYKEGFFFNRWAVISSHFDLEEAKEYLVRETERDFEPVIIYNT